MWSSDLFMREGIRDPELSPGEQHWFIVNEQFDRF
jgi:hypothetical protein